MKYLFTVFKSKYCVIVFILALIASYFLIPKQVFYKWYTALALVFMLTISSTITCIVRNVKERIALSRTTETSILSIIATGIGITALQVCGVGAPVCGASLSMGFLSFLFPTVFTGFITRHATLIIGFSIALQIIALYFMNCFKSVQALKPLEHKTIVFKKTL